MLLEKLRKVGRIKPKRVNQKAHKNRVAALGCLVCKGPAEIHHVRAGNQSKDDRRIVSLCAGHHRHNADSFHRLGNVELFFQAHGIDLVKEADWNWLETVNEGLAK